MNMFEMTAGRWFLLWLLGLFIAWVTTAWKDEAEGLLGLIFYLLGSIILCALFAGISLFVKLWVLWG